MNLSRLVFHSTLSSPKIDRLLIKLNQSAHAYHSLMSRPVQDCHTSQPLLLALSQRTRINVISQQLRSYRICTTPRTIISISEFPSLHPPTPPHRDTLACGSSKDIDLLGWVSLCISTWNSTICQRVLSLCSLHLSSPCIKYPEPHH